MKEIQKAESRIFSMTRFSQVLKSDLRINRPGYLKIVLATVGCFLTIAIMISIFAIKAKHLQQSVYYVNGIPVDVLHYIQVKYVGYYQMASFVIVSVGLTIFGSLTFVSMNSKEGRISTIMMPALMLEKFLVRFLIYFIGGLLVLGIGFFVGMAELLLTFANLDTLMPIEAISGGDKSMIVTMYTVIACPMLLGNAFYALGSSIWPRASWVKTWVAQQILGILFLFLGAFGLFDFIPAFLYSLDKGFENGDWIYWLYVVTFTVLGLGCWVAAWWRFRTTQIVQRFMKK